jgi:hypothetical protein
MKFFILKSNINFTIYLKDTQIVVANNPENK